MSLETIIWAFRQQIRPSMTKFVLVALGDNANDETGIAFPSIAAICHKTSQNRKTVMGALRQLCSAEVISDTGKRVGTTKQVVVYRLDGYVADLWARRRGETVPQPAPLPNSAVSDSEQSRFYLGTGPKTGHGTATEPQSNHNPPNPPPGGTKARDMKAGRPTNPHAIRVAAVVGRQAKTEWSPKEVKLFKTVAKRQDFENELSMIERYYAKNRKKADNCCRRSLDTLLNNWTTEVDRALPWCEKNPLPGERKIAAPRPAPPEPTLPEVSTDPEANCAFLEEWERTHNGKLPLGWARDGDSFKFVGRKQEE